MAGNACPTVEYPAKRFSRKREESVMQALLDKLQRKLGRYAIPNLMLYIVAGMAVVFVVDMVVYPVTGFSARSLFMFSRAAIMRGQIWRLITFIFIPPSSSTLFIIFSLYFYWMIGTALQQQWGSFRFNLFYLCGIIGSVIAGFITGGATNTYLNMSLFLAFALIYPDFQIMIFFMIPLKVKWLALLDAISLLLMFMTDSWAGRLALVMAMANLALFFWRDGYLTIKNAYRRYQWKQNWRR